MSLPSITGFEQKDLPVLNEALRTLDEKPYDGVINFIIAGHAGAAIAAGIKGDLVIPFTCRLVAWELLADQNGNIKIDIWKDTYANFPPVDADSITNAHEPEIPNPTAKAQDADLSDWATTVVTTGDILRINVDSVATHTLVTLSLKYTR